MVAYVENDLASLLLLSRPAEARSPLLVYKGHAGLLAAVAAEAGRFGRFAASGIGGQGVLGDTKTSVHSVLLIKSDI